MLKTWKNSRLDGELFFSALSYFYYALNVFFLPLSPGSIFFLPLAILLLPLGISFMPLYFRAALSLVCGLGHFSNEIQI